MNLVYDEELLSKFYPKETYTYADIKRKVEITRAVDAKEVVYCKDCIHAHDVLKYPDVESWQCRRTVHYTPTEADGWCKWGEKAVD